MEAQCKTEQSVKDEAGEREFYDGKYLFLRDKGSKDAKRYFWRCNQKHHGCMARLHTLATTGAVVHRQRSHNHSHLREIRRGRLGNADKRRHGKEAIALSGSAMMAQNQSDYAAVKDEKDHACLGATHNSQLKADHAAAKAAFGYIRRSGRHVVRRVPPVSKDLRLKFGRLLPSGRVIMRNVAREVDDMKPFIADTKPASTSSAAPKSNASEDGMPLPLVVMKRFLNLPPRKLAVTQDLFTDLLNEIEITEF
ncbi:hypothetical protein AAVH_06574 [Aphelenchoides avenae]|nr:hypothetical protein AAVH_06574 [Aphelenchus avenae]